MPTPRHGHEHVCRADAGLKWWDNVIAMCLVVACCLLLAPDLWGQGCGNMYRDNLRDRQKGTIGRHLRSVVSHQSRRTINLGVPLAAINRNLDQDKVRPGWRLPVVFNKPRQCRQGTARNERIPGIQSYQPHQLPHANVRPPGRVHICGHNHKHITNQYVPIGWQSGL